jgi:Mlc titration factor MtfA (ptsG expression regulator)
MIEMFGWKKNRSRRQLRDRPVLDSELSDLKVHLWQASRLNDEQLGQLVRWSRVLIHEKRWEGCSGLGVTDTMKQTISASAGLMVLAYPEWYFDRTSTILVHPRPYVGRTPTTTSVAGVVSEHARSGETMYRGPVVLNWQDVYRESVRPFDGHHLVIHEFAHQLDMINGPWADGFPPLPNHVNENEWRKALQAEFDAACEIVSRGDAVLINDYGLTNLSEFFAVASELYFQTPENLSEYHPGVFDLLLDFYQLDLRAIDR